MNEFITKYDTLVSTLTKDYKGTDPVKAHENYLKKKKEVDRLDMLQMCRSLYEYLLTRAHSKTSIIVSRDCLGFLSAEIERISA